MSNLKKNLTFIFLVVFTASFVASTFRNVVRYFRLHKELVEKEQELKSLTAVNETMKKDLITFNDQNLEALVRDKLSMAKKGETIIILPENIVKNEERQKVDIKDGSDFSNWQKWLGLFL